MSEKRFDVSGMGTMILQLDFVPVYSGPLPLIARRNVCHGELEQRLRTYLAKVKSCVRKLLNKLGHGDVKIGRQRRMPFAVDRRTGLPSILVTMGWPGEGALDEAFPSEPQYDGESKLARAQRLFLDRLATALREIPKDESGVLQLPNVHSLPWARYEKIKQQVAQRSQNNDWMDDIPDAA